MGPPYLPHHHQSSAALQERKQKELRGREEWELGAVKCHLLDLALFGNSLGSWGIVSGYCVASSHKELLAPAWLLYFPCRNNSSRYIKQSILLAVKPPSKNSKQKQQQQEQQKSCYFLVVTWQWVSVFIPTPRPSKCALPSSLRKVEAPCCSNKTVSACWDWICLFPWLIFIAGTAMHSHLF